MSIWDLLLYVDIHRFVLFRASMLQEAFELSKQIEISQGL